MKPFKVTGWSERGYLEKYQWETRETVLRERFAKSQTSKPSGNDNPEATQSKLRITAAAVNFTAISANKSIQAWILALAMANLTSRDPPRPTEHNDSESA